MQYVSPAVILIGNPSAAQTITGSPTEALGDHEQPGCQAIAKRLVVRLREDAHKGLLTLVRAFSAPDR
jgi:hypothetical protein